MSPILQQPFIPQLILIGKVVGAVGVVGGFIFGMIKFAHGSIKKVASISDNVELLLNNHFPHLDAAITETSKQVGIIGSDVRNLDTKLGAVSTRLDDTRNGVKVLGDSFLRHLEAASQEKIIYTANIAENKLKIAAIEAAEKIKDVSPALVVVESKEM